jgi:eukaryotic-like serine/threonine-protein kinase
MTSTLPVEIGEIVNDKYRIERVLGEGGMGVVVLAHHILLDQKVAMKFLLPQAGAELEVQNRFVNEARASAKLKSDHVTRIIDVDTLVNGSPFMVMEYLEGKDLSTLLSERGSLPVSEACQYVLDACEALAEAHARGIIHRDLKPGNLFIHRTSEGTEIVKLLDFGISKIVAPEGQGFSLTKTSAVLGSPLYMPPEQMSSARTVDTRADLWSLGIVLYEAVTGRTPFEGATLTTLVANIIQEPPKPMAASGVAIPEGFEALVLRCLEKNPAARIGSVRELAHALADFVPRSSRESLDRIDRFDTIRSSLLPSPPSSSPDSNLTPAKLVRVKMVVPEDAAATIVTPRTETRAHAATNGSQIIDTSPGRRLQDTLEPSVPGQRPWPIFAAVGALVVVTGIAASFLSRSPTAPAPLPVSASATTSGSPPPSPLPPVTLDAALSAVPAPPSTFTGAVPSPPVPPTRPSTKGPVAPLPPPTASNASETPPAVVSPPPVPPPPSPRHRPPPQNIDMEPK